MYHVELRSEAFNVGIDIGYDDFTSDQQAARQER